MNRHQAALLMEKIRGRAQAFHRQSNTKREFRVQASTSGATAIYLYDYIGGWDGISAKDMVDTLASITGDVDLHINSGGGDIFEGTAIYNALRNHSGVVRSYVDGIAASAASFVAMAAEEVIMEEGSTMMIHDGWGFTIGNEQDHLDAAGVLGMLSGNIAGMYAKKAGGTAEAWRETMRGEKWYTAEEAVSAGLADRLSSTGNEAENRFDLSIFNYSPPEAPAKPAADPTIPTAFDVEGLRNALKGAFA